MRRRGVGCETEKELRGRFELVYYALRSRE